MNLKRKKCKKLERETHKYFYFKELGEKIT